MQGLEDVPTWFSDFMNITLEAGQMILSITVIIAVLLPLLYLNMRGSGPTTNLPIIIMFFLTESLLVGIGWLPFWILIATLAVTALAIASMGTKLVTGG